MPTLTMTPHAIKEAFRAAMEANGITPPDKIVADGKIHHFSTNGKHKDDAGRYVLHTDGVPAGWFKDWRAGVDETWCAKSSQTMSTEERKAHRQRMEAIRKEREAEEKQRHAEAAKRAQQIWDAAKPASNSHPYLQRKGVPAHKLRLYRGPLVVAGEPIDKSLIVPLHAPEGGVCSLEFITTEGQKLLLPGGRKRGAAYPIRTIHTSQTIICIIEGWASGLSVWLATDNWVIIAFDAGNLEPVAKNLRAKYPTVELVICADNDFHTDGKPNTGLLAAEKAAQAVNGVLAVPPVLDNSKTDWNDVFVKQGLEAVKQGIEAVMALPQPKGQSVSTEVPTEDHSATMNGDAQAEEKPKVEEAKSPESTDPPSKSSDPSLSGGPGGPSGADASQEQQNSADHQKNEGGPKRSSGPQETVEFSKVEGYQIKEDGVFESDTRLTLRPCGVLAFCRDGSAQNWGAFLGWLDRDGHYHEAAFPVGRFHETGSGILIDLAGLGLPIVPGMERRVLRYLASSNPDTRYRVATQTGWTDSGRAFVLPNRTLDGPSSKDKERVVYQPDRHSPSRHSVRTSGTLEGWKADVAAPCVGNPILEFWLSASFAAPLLHPLQLEGGGFQLFGPTSKGKTTAEQVAASVWGDGSDPAEGRGSAYVRKWNLTKNATEGLAEAFSDLPLCLDEVGEADAREFGRIIYQLAGGQGKGRMQADATLKPPKVWRTLLLSTGELPAADVIQSEGRRLKGGQVVRLVDIPATDPLSGNGIIEHLHGSESPAHFVDALKRACAEHYGHAGPAFIEALLKEGLPVVRAELKAALHELMNKLTPKGASSELQRIIKRVALVGLAGTLASDLSILPWPKNEAVHAAKLIAGRICAAREGADGDTDRAVGGIKDFLLAHGGSRFRELANSAEKVFDLAGYRDALSDTFYFTPAGFKEACGGHDSRAVARELKSKGYLRVPDDKHLTERVTVAGIGRTRLYAVSAKVLDDEPVKAG